MKQQKDRKSGSFESGKCVILMEDSSITGVYKPPGMLSQGDRTGDPDLVSFLKRRYRNEPGSFVGLVHRLDRPACGVMVLARTPGAAASLSRQITGFQWVKTYLAVVHGHPQRTGSFHDHLFIDRNVKKTFTDSVDGSSVHDALMEYAVLEEHANRSLLKIVLHTGKKHQIRAQLASRGYPIVGDRKYGSSEVLRNPGMIALCAWSLEFQHPVTGAPVRLDSPRPLHWPWHGPALFSGSKEIGLKKPVRNPNPEPARYPEDISGRQAGRRKTER
ncbi:RNA pseudouridine synthase [bacterium]|nr:RNA pseudouridine synthase [candidate division CSSED10-310 bacterium]